MQTALEARRVSGSLLRLASMGLLAICACRGTPLAQPGRSFDDSRTSLKAGTVSREDAERIEEHRLAARAGDPKARTHSPPGTRQGRDWKRNFLAVFHGSCSIKFS